MVVRIPVRDKGEDLIYQDRVVEIVGYAIASQMTGLIHYVHALSPVLYSSEIVHNFVRDGSLVLTFALAGIAGYKAYKMVKSKHAKKWEVD